MFGTNCSGCLRWTLMFSCEADLMFSTSWAGAAESLSRCLWRVTRQTFAKALYPSAPGAMMVDTDLCITAYHFITVSLQMTASSTPWFWQISLHLGPGVRKPVSWVVYYVSASRQAPRGTGKKKQKHKQNLFFSEHGRRLCCPDCSIAFLCWLLSSALISFKASFRDHTRTDLSTTTLHLKYFCCQWLTGFFYCSHCSASKVKFSEELCR